MVDKKEKFLDRFYWLFFSLILILLCFLSFYKLGDISVKEWDEARHGVNAYEMIKNNNYIANLYNGSLDYWNLKPPISYYFVMLGYKIFGFNGWGLRFFSALSYILTSILISLFLKKNSTNLASLISLFAFCCYYQYFAFHYVRSGDADSLFILFYSVSFIGLYLSQKNSNWLCLTGFFTALMFLTKSWHAFIIAPVVIIFWIITKQYKNMKWWQYLTALASFIIPILIWGIIRYNFDGFKFISEMINYDLLSRSNTTLEGHNGSIFYYVFVLWDNSVIHLFLIIFIIKMVQKIINKEKLSSLDYLCLVSFLSTFIIFSIAKTKLIWYIFPIVIPMTIVGSMYSYNLFSKSKLEFIKNAFVLIISICSLINSFFVISSKDTIIKQTYSSFQNTNQYNDEIQIFISSLDIKNIDIYYEINENTIPTQNALLEIEWQTNSTIKLGGYKEFIKNNNSYIVMKNSDAEKYEIPNNIQIVKSQNNYILYHNPS